MNYFNKFYSLINFPKRSDSKLDDYFTLSKGYLFRRDEHRLVALKLQKNDKMFNYNFSELEKIQNSLGISLTESGELIFNSKTENISLLPLKDIKLKDESIKTLFYPGNFIKFFISTKELSKQISIIQRKIMLDNKNEEDVNISLDIKNGKLYSNELNYKFKINIKSDEQLKDLTFHYNFSFFRDLLINSNKFNNWVEFNVYNSQFTRIIFDKYISGVLLHSKI